MFLQKMHYACTIMTEVKPLALPQVFDDVLLADEDVAARRRGRAGDHRECRTFSSAVVPEKDGYLRL